MPQCFLSGNAVVNMTKNDCPNGFLEFASSCINWTSILEAKPMEYSEAEEFCHSMPGLSLYQWQGYLHDRIFVRGIQQLVSMMYILPCITSTYEQNVSSLLSSIRSAYFLPKISQHLPYFIRYRLVSLLKAQCS